MNNQQSIDLLLLKIKNLIASKEQITATAMREQALGGWLSDHNAACLSIDIEIESLELKIQRHE